MAVDITVYPRTPPALIRNPINDTIAEFVAHSRPSGVRTAAGVAPPGNAAEGMGGDPVPRGMPGAEGNPWEQSQRVVV